MYISLDVNSLSIRIINHQVTPNYQCFKIFQGIYIKNVYTKLLNWWLSKIIKIYDFFKILLCETQNKIKTSSQA